jgi:hypothetical protein
MSLEVRSELPSELNGILRMEMGWSDVRRGLSRVALGYWVFILGTLLGIGMVWYILHRAGEEGGLARVSNPVDLWIFYAGLGLLSSIGIFSYIIMMSGKWWCLTGASERHGARWFMFACMVALFMAPALEIASITAGAQRGVELKRGLEALDNLQFNSMGRYLQIASAVSFVLYIVSFVLFLRAVANCFASRSHVMLVDLFLLFTTLMAAGTGYVLFALNDPLKQRELMPFLGGGWVVCCLWHLLMMSSVRALIADTISRVRSPLDV